MSTLATLVTKLKLKVIFEKAGVLTDPTDYQSFIQDAVKFYSKRRPYNKAVALTGDGNAYFSVPSDWEVQFSTVVDIEYPLDDVPPIKIQNKKFKVENTPTGYQVRFYDYCYPALDEDFNMRYTIRHEVDADSSTVPIADEDAVISLAASKLCKALAVYYANTADPTFSADVVSYRTRGDEMNSRATAYYKEYDKEITPDVTGVIGEWDMDSFWGDGEEPLMTRKALI